MSADQTPGGSPRREKPRLEQEVGDAVQELGRIATGVVGHVFGAKAVGRAEGEVPSVSPAVDDAIDRVGDTLGKILHAVGDGVAQHPTAPDQAVKAVGRNLRDPSPVPKAPGWSGLTAGLGALARGLGAVGEKVADELSGARPSAEPAAAAAPAEEVSAPAEGAAPAEPAPPAAPDPEPPAPPASGAP